MVTFNIFSDDSGHSIRCTYIAKFLAKFYRVVVFSFPEELDDRMSIGEPNIIVLSFKGNEKRSAKLIKLFSFDPIATIRLIIYNMVIAVVYRKILKNCLSIFIESALFLPFAFYVRHILKKPIILDTQTSMKLLASRMRPGFGAKVRYVAWDLLERFSAKLSDIVIVVSEEEKHFWKNEYNIPVSKIVVIPHVLPNTGYGFGKLRKARRSLSKKKGHIYVTFIGNLFVIHNREAAEYIIKVLAPRFHKIMPSVTFLIVGKGYKLLENMVSSPNVKFTGYVDNLEEVAELTDIFIAPLISGSGVKTKMLFYLSTGKPIVATPVALEGIMLESDIADKVVISNIGSFERALLNLLSTRK